MFRQEESRPQPGTSQALPCHEATPATRNLQRPGTRRRGLTAPRSRHRMMIGMGRQSHPPDSISRHPLVRTTLRHVLTCTSSFRQESLSADALLVFWSFLYSMCSVGEKHWVLRTATSIEEVVLVTMCIVLLMAISDLRMGYVMYTNFPSRLHQDQRLVDSASFAGMISRQALIKLPIVLESKEL